MVGALDRRAPHRGGRLPAAWSTASRRGTPGAGALRHDPLLLNRAGLYHEGAWIASTSKNHGSGSTARRPSFATACGAASPARQWQPGARVAAPRRFLGPARQSRLIVAGEVSGHEAREHELIIALMIVMTGASEAAPLLADRANRSTPTWTADSHGRSPTAAVTAIAPSRSSPTVTPVASLPGRESSQAMPKPMNVAIGLAPRHLPQTGS